MWTGHAFLLFFLRTTGHALHLRGQAHSRAYVVFAGAKHRAKAGTELRIQRVEQQQPSYWTAALARMEARATRVMDAAGFLLVSRTAEGSALRRVAVALSSPELTERAFRAVLRTHLQLWDNAKTHAAARKRVLRFARDALNAAKAIARAGFSAAKHAAYESGMPVPPEPQPPRAKPASLGALWDAAKLALAQAALESRMRKRARLGYQPFLHRGPLPGPLFAAFAAHEWTELSKINRQLRDRPVAVQEWQLLLLLLRAHVAQFVSSGANAITLALLYPLCWLVFWEAIFWVVVSQIARAFGARNRLTAPLEPSEPRMEPPWTLLREQVRDIMEEWTEEWQTVCEEVGARAQELSGRIMAQISQPPVWMRSRVPQPVQIAEAQVARIQSIPGLFVRHF